MMTMATTADAQVGEDFLSRTGPTPPYRSPQPNRYNLKWGELTGRLTGTVVAEFNDNINLSENNKVADISIGPEIGFGFLYPISDRNVLQLDIGVGYRWYLNSPDVSTITVSPRSSSRLDYYLYFEEGRVNLHDIFYVQISPVDIAAANNAAGGGVNLSRFQRFVNTVGISSDWRPAKQWVFYAGYDYTIDRSLNSDFTSLDRDDHTFTSGVNYVANSRLTVGAYSAFTFSMYRQAVQNDGWNFSIGPRLSYQLTKFISLEASAGWTTSDYFDTGSIADQSNFSSFTYQAGVRHTINKRTNHGLRGGRSLGLGYGSNFTDTYNVQYSINWLASQGVSIYSTLAYEHIGVSNFGESANRYLFNIGSGFKLSRQWTMGVSYTLGLKESDTAGNDYIQNRITIDLTRQF
ncbi:MAG TPA: hypothetical protein VGH19_01910 [Verrucomicrobiae bacterium]